MPKRIPNQQWTYIIVDIGAGDVHGTNDIKVAKEFALVEENFVIEVPSCTVITPVQGESDDIVFDNENIAEQQQYKLEGRDKPAADSDN